MTDVPADFDEADTALRIAVCASLSTADFTSAFASFLVELKSQCASLLEHIPQEAERPMALGLFRAVWVSAPRPDLGWQCPALPKPERNGHCPCGSGSKYKQCCGRAEVLHAFPTEGLSVLGYVLETVPVSSYETLPYKMFDPEEVADVANQWQEKGRTAAATALLEGLLAPGQRLGRHHEWAFDTLCNLYLDAGRDGDRLALVSRLTGVSDKRLSAAAWQRRATLYADSGEHEAAWSAFDQAMRLDPDNPVLAHLELVMLANQDRFDEVQARAAFWAKRLARAGHADEAVIELMEDVAANPDVLRRMMTDSFGDPEEEIAAEAVEALEALVGALPAPASHYRLSPDGNSLGPLEPEPALQAIEAEWADIIGTDPDDIWNNVGCLVWLKDHPLAWQSFEVLESVVDAINDRMVFEPEDGRLDAMEAVVLAHAVAVLRAVLAHHSAGERRLEWGWKQNRTALELLMQRIDCVCDTPEELSLLEWLVLDLNPIDNSGHRERLVHVYCEASRPADALAVCDRYPEDRLAGILYGRVLALYLLGRRGEAVAALATASKRLPKVLKTLVAARPKAPPLTPGQIKHGGADEAWIYRAEYQPTWIACDAYEWVRMMAGERR